jgi:hypothetical protein
MYTANTRTNQPTNLKVLRMEEAKCHAINTDALKILDSMSAI